MQIRHESEISVSQLTANGNANGCIQYMTDEKAFVHFYTGKILLAVRLKILSLHTTNHLQLKSVGDDKKTCLHKQLFQVKKGRCLHLHKLRKRKPVPWCKECIWANIVDWEALRQCLPLLKRVFWDTICTDLGRVTFIDHESHCSSNSYQRNFTSWSLR